MYSDLGQPGIYTPVDAQWSADRFFFIVLCLVVSVHLPLLYHAFMHVALSFNPNLAKKASSYMLVEVVVRWLLLVVVVHMGSLAAVVALVSLSMTQVLDQKKAVGASLHICIG